MINKVLIAEDHETANLSVQKTLEELGVAEPHYVFYCDDALLKIQKAKQANYLYDLLITDLYFEEDQSKQKLADGMALIVAARKIQPELKILVFSGEKKPAIIEMLYEKLKIDGYVRKARNDKRELKAAIQVLSHQQRYFPRHLAQMIAKGHAYDFQPYDMRFCSNWLRGRGKKIFLDTCVNKSLKHRVSAVLRSALN